MKKLLVFFFFCSPGVSAQENIWKGSPYYITADSLDLKDVLQGLGANYKVPVVVSEIINDKWTGTLHDVPAGHILDELSGMYQLQSFWDGNTLYIYKSQEIVRLYLTPQWLTPARIVRLIRKSGFKTSNACKINTIGDSLTLEVIGVPACVERVKMLSKELDDQEYLHNQNKEDIFIYPLKYASAMDTTYTYRNQSVVVSGVVSVLKQMYPSPSSPPSPPGKEGIAVTSELPVFSADTRRNAVLIRDRKSNFLLYRGILPELDKRPELVEISVAIIDVNAGDLNQLGIDWSASAKIGGGSVSFNNTSGLQSDSFSSLISNAGDFMIRLSALEQKSKARIVSRPSVLTLDNVQAVLDRSITFYTKLVSEKNAALDSVVAGALMRVTPRLIHEKSGERVMLTLNIQDGKQSSPLSLTENLPQVQNAEIATQATLKPGQALLLGGFVQEENTEQENKIPLLGDLPLIGGLFRSTNENHRSVVRLFLIKAEPKQL